MSVTRRSLIAGAAAVALLPRAALAQTPAFAIDWQGGEQTPALLAALDAQIALVKSVRVKPEVAAFFAEQVITVDLVPNTKTRAGQRGVFFQRSPLPPPENPVLLHELLHRYHLLKLPDGFANATVLDFYKRAKAAGDWPPQAYLYTNDKEFFAMVASVALCGHAARPPYTRALVREKLPEMYRWIVGEFGLET
ncbi:MAG: hypothetical protein E7773_04155 [Sphingomonas sp.]|uniref:hypothetical protein n=1 Tax=Sphingomonas sp. TaxID=28214 RepID=UPI001229AF9C|nr:hypothetical protein [Sphingomonas sp.]THD37236.1 MAG: hypothetical protein E7773_04155 [Sphingomonas sp.]